MRPLLTALLSVLLLAPYALADDSASPPVNRQAWQLCQAGHLAQCERTLRSGVDDETRMLVEADRQFARDKISAHARLLLSACDARSNVRACDRALSYSLSASERQEVLTLRKAVVQRAVIRVNR